MSPTRKSDRGEVTDGTESLLLSDSLLARGCAAAGLFDAPRYVVHSGCPWRFQPADFSS